MDLDASLFRDVAGVELVFVGGVGCRAAYWDPTILPPLPEGTYLCEPLGDGGRSRRHSFLEGFRNLLYGLVVYLHASVQKWHFGESGLIQWFLIDTEVFVDFCA
jgi:hypothetical protein